MSKKPSYLGLLNAIAIGEERGYRLFTTWAETTTNPDLARVLNRVALREREHAAAFAKRVNELGYSLKPAPAEEFESAMALAESARSDRKKFESLLKFSDETSANKRGKGKKKHKDKDPLSRIFRDHSIDIQTGELLGRFIAEERDSERLLRACYERLCEEAKAEQEDWKHNGESKLSLQDLGMRLDRLSETLEQLKSLKKPGI